MFKVKRQVGTRGREGCASSRGSGLATLSAKPSCGKVVFLGKVVIELDYPVVAVTKRRTGGEIVSGIRRQVIDQAGPEISHQIFRDRTFGNSIRHQQRQGVALICRGWFGVQTRQSNRIFLFLKGDKPEGFVL